MAFKLIRQRGAVQVTPLFVRVLGSGTINSGSVVEFHRATNNNRVEPASSATTYTTIFGIALDYVQGASDSYTRVIPFVPGQFWEADCANFPATAQVLIRHALTDARTINNTSTNVNAATGVFFIHSISRTIFASQSTGTFRVIGEFLRSPASYSL